jgi:hypothetical protein
MTMSSTFVFQQKRILVSVLTVAAVVFSPAPIVAQPINPFPRFYEPPKPGGFLFENNELGDRARAPDKWTRNRDRSALLSEPKLNLSPLAQEGPMREDSRPACPAPQNDTLLEILAAIVE